MDAIGYYNSIAPSYDALYKEEQSTKINTIIALINPKKSWRILDIGAGTGLLEESLKGVKITALEPSEMADLLAAKKLPNVRLERKKISQFESKRRFDAVFCVTVLQDLDKKERAKCIAAAFKFCKTGGKIIISVLKQSKIDLSNLKPISVCETANDVVYIFKK